MAAKNSKFFRNLPVPSGLQSRGAGKLACKLASSRGPRATSSHFCKWRHKPIAEARCWTNAKGSCYCGNVTCQHAFFFLLSFAPFSTSMYIALVRQEANEARHSPRPAPAAPSGCQPGAHEAPAQDPRRCPRLRAGARAGSWRMPAAQQRPVALPIWKPRRIAGRNQAGRHGSVLNISISSHSAGHSRHVDAGAHTFRHALTHTFSAGT